MEDDQLKAVQEAARIPYNLRDVKLDQCGGDIGVTLKSYVLSPQYADDRKAGIGIGLYGIIAPAKRQRVFGVLARAMVLKGDSILYLSLATLCDAVTQDNHPVHDQAAAVGGLFIVGMYDQSVELPVSFRDRMYIENFLTQRTEQGKRNYYSTSKKFIDADWWSIDFRASQNEALRSFIVDMD